MKPTLQPPAGLFIFRSIPLHVHIREGLIYPCLWNNLWRDPTLTSRFIKPHRSAEFECEARATVCLSSASNSTSTNAQRWQVQAHYHTHLTPLEGYTCRATLLSARIRVSFLPLLEEADEGGDSGAWPDHHEGHRHVRRRSEGAVRPQAHVDLGSKAISECFRK